MPSAPSADTAASPIDRKGIAARIDRKGIAARIVALTGMGASALAKNLGVSAETLDKLVFLTAREATYARVLPRLEKIETALTAYKTEREAESAALLAFLDDPADERGQRSASPLAVRPSQIHGLGAFANRACARGQLFEPLPAGFVGFNHSVTPNAKGTRKGAVALRDIANGEEVTVDYGPHVHAPGYFGTGCAS